MHTEKPAPREPTRRDMRATQYIVQREGEDGWHDIGFSRTSKGAQDVFAQHRADYPSAVLRIVPLYRGEIV